MLEVLAYTLLGVGLGTSTGPVLAFVLQGGEIKCLERMGFFICGTCLGTKSTWS